MEAKGHIFRYKLMNIQQCNTCGLQFTNEEVRSQTLDPHLERGGRGFGFWLKVGPAECAAASGTLWHSFSTTRIKEGQGGTGGT